MFGSTAYVPLFVQAVLGASATEAGATLMPMLIGWVLASIVGSRLLLTVGYRTIALVGMALLVVGTFLMTQVGTTTGAPLLLGSLALMGVGMGLSIPAFLIAVQSTVRREALGTATSTVQFSRSIGGTLGVSVMGAVLSAQLASGLLAAGIDPASISLNALLDPIAGASNAALDATLRTVLADAIQSVFWLAFGAAVLALAVTALAPAGRIAQLAARRAQDDADTAAPPIVVTEM
jgi:MFS family permease